MYKIIIRGGPVSPMQQVYVIEDNVICESIGARYEDIAEVVNCFVKKYPIEAVEFAGPKSYMSMFEEQIKEYQLTEYSNQVLVFRYI